MFDLMKCNDKEKFIKEKLGDYDYLILHEVIFSLKDLVEANEGSFKNKLLSFDKTMREHLEECKDCLYKGAICNHCKAEEIIYAYDVERVIYCRVCKSYTHKDCVMINECILKKINKGL